MMEGYRNETVLNENEFLELLNETSVLAVKRQMTNIQIATDVYQTSKNLVDKVEFWEWMNRNFNGAGGNMFSSNSAMRQYIHGGQGKADWVYKQLQGKGYEWDWMQKQRDSFRNIFKVYDAGNISNQAAIDVTEYNVITGKKTEYQMKAYISKNNPDLHNTGKDVTVITNAEKAETVRKNGYTVEPYKNRAEIIDDVDERMREIENGKATPSYSIKNVGGAMAKSGLIGCAFGVGTEAAFSYRKWKAHELTDEEYLEEILRAGCNSGTTAAISTGIMIPVSATVTAAGVTSLINVPVAFAVTAGVNQFVAPCFGRGDYRKVINEAYYFTSMERCYSSFVKSIEIASNEYNYFVNEILEQDKTYKQLRNKEKYINNQLKDLYDSIDSVKRTMEKL